MKLKRTPTSPAALLAAAAQLTAAAPQPEWEDEHACAARFGVSVHFIRKLRYSGRLRAAAINGRVIRIRIQDARDFFEKHIRGGGDGAAALGACAVWKHRAATQGDVASLRPLRSGRRTPAAERALG